MSILCGTLDDLPKAFAMLDANDRSKSLPVRQAAARLADTQEAPDIVSSSLPKADRDIIRTSKMRKRIIVEAKSRAPHRPVRATQSHPTVD